MDLRATVIEATSLMTLLEKVVDIKASKAMLADIVEQATKAVNAQDQAAKSLAQAESLHAEVALLKDRLDKLKNDLEARERRLQDREKAFVDRAADAERIIKQLHSGITSV